MLLLFALLLFLPLIIRSRTSHDTEVGAAFRALSSGRVTVKISGDVRHEGLYALPVGATPQQAASAALPDDFPMQNIAVPPNHKPLVNGDALLVKSRPDGTSVVELARMSVSEKIILRIPLVIAEMTETDFSVLPGVGAALAKRIVDFRASKQGVMLPVDLLEVEGIGEKKYRKLAVYFAAPLKSD